MQIIKYPARSEWASLLTRPTFDNTTLFSTVQKILDDVKSRGDKAVNEYTEQFDKEYAFHLLKKRENAVNEPLF